MTSSSSSRLASEDVFSSLTYCDLETASSCSLVSKQFSCQALRFLIPLRKKILYEFIGSESEVALEGKQMLQHWHSQTSKMFVDCKERDRLMKYWQVRWATGKMDEQDAEEAWHRQEDGIDYDMDDEAVRMEQEGEAWIKKASKYLASLHNTRKQLDKKHNFSKSTKSELDMQVSTHNDFYNQLSSLQAMLQQWSTQCDQWDEFSDNDFLVGCLFATHSTCQLNFKPGDELRQQESALSKLDLTLRKIKKPPGNPQYGQPLSVKLGFYLESLGNFRETQMTFDVDLYLYMSWRDSTLTHPGPEYIMVNDDAVRKQLWLPDLYFANARQANFHHVTVPNFNLFISPDGTVAYSSRVTLSVACNLDLVDYPMDHQNCYIKVLSYAYIAKTVNVTWFDTTPILFNPEIGLPEFTISAVTAEQCNGSYRYAVTESSYKLDQFSCLTCNLYLTRALGFNMVQSYIPTGLIVIISWVSFWIDRRAVPARVTLSFTTLLSLTTIGNGMRFALPQVSYAKAIDYWFGGCMVFVFLALLEYAVVNSYMRRSEKYEKLSNKFSVAKEDYLSQSSIVSTAFERTHAQMIKATQRRKSSAMALIGGIKRNLSFNNTQSTSDLSRPEQEVNKAPEQKTEIYPPVDFQKLRNVTELDVEISKMINEAFEDNNEPLLNGSYYDNVSPQLLVKRPPAYVPLQNASKKIQQEVKAPIVKPKNVKRSKTISFEESSNESEEEKIFSRSFRRRPSTEPNLELSIKYLEACQLLSRRALNTDKISRLLFPIMFIIFNILYWGYYLIVRQIS